MGRNITYCYNDYLEYIDEIENKSGGWKSNKTEYGIIFGCMLFVGPYYEPDSFSKLRPGFVIHYINAHDAAILMMM